MTSVKAPAGEECRNWLKQVENAWPCDKRENACVKRRAPVATTPMNGARRPRSCGITSCIRNPSTLYFP